MDPSLAAAPPPAVPAMVWPVPLRLRVWFFERGWLGLLGPQTVLGVAGLALLVFSLHFSLRRRDGQSALFCIRLGLYLSLIEVVWRPR